MLPNEATIKATHSGNLPFGLKLSQRGTNALVFPGLSNESLLSIGQLCDDNCVAIFTKNRVYVVKDNDLIMHGPRNRTDNLWDIQLPAHQRDKIQAAPTTSCLSYIITKDKTKSDLARYLHATAFSPRISTFSKAIRNGNFVTWPGIENLNFEKLIGTTIASELGHLDQERKNLQSTKVRSEEEDDFFPSVIEDKTYNIFCKISSAQQKMKAYTDLTGRFPHKSSRGNEYLFTMYDYDSNAILQVPIKNRQGKVIAEAFTACYDKLTKHGHVVKLFVMDNECSTDLQREILKIGGNYELVPPYMHRRNAAEVAIKTAKNHLLAGLATCEPDFPISEWDRLLRQCELTLNLLRSYNSKKVLLRGKVIA